MKKLFVLKLVYSADNIVSLSLPTAEEDKATKFQQMLANYPEMAKYKNSMVWIPYHG